MNELKISNDKFIRVTYGALLFIMAGIVGFAVWMATMESKANANSGSISKLEDLNVNINETLTSIDRRLQRIEIILETSSNHKKGE
jgi:high-affinity Fe2+/Pb2+ permease